MGSNTQQWAASSSPAHQRRTRASVVFAIAVAVVQLMAPPASAVNGPTVVSLTFNDAHTSQYTYARPVLQAHSAQATFYASSGWVDAGTNSSMAWYQLRNLYRDGNEVGGMGTNHKNLTILTSAEAQQEVCGDRQRFADMGVDPQSFSYPAAAVNASVESIVQACGYRSGRTIGGLVAATSTTGPWAETTPPADAYAVRTAFIPTGAISLATLQADVDAAASHGGGWLPISFNQVCADSDATTSPCMTSAKPIRQGVLSQFLDWLQSTSAPAGTTIKTVRDVMGAPAPPPLAPDTTKVSLTFNDGTVGEYAYARPVLQAHGMNGTFYVATGQVDKNFSCCMAYWQLDNLFRDGNEIGGMGKDHLTLTSLDTATATQQVCDDRQRLAGLGYDPKSFAYVQALTNASVESIVAGCGYLSARSVGGIATTSATGPWAESVPPKDAFNVRTPNTTTSGALSLSELQNNVTTAAARGGGWTPLVFSDVCHQGSANYSACMSASRTVDDAVLSQFLDWLAAAGQAGGAPANTTVQTVRQVMGAAAQPPLAARPTDVSLTFDDGRTSQYLTRSMLSSHNVHGTFYINSGNVDVNDGSSMTWAQIADLGSDGNDIGGHTSHHVNIKGTALTYDQKYREVCDDRQRLLQQGFNPANFAYPEAAFDATAESIVQACGYSTGRSGGGLSATGPTYAETIPPRDPYATRALGIDSANTGPMSLSFLQDAVNAASTHGGGWVQILFHNVCDASATDYSTCMASYRPVDSSVLNSFLDWLSTAAPPGTSVRDVAEVMGTTPKVFVASPTPGQTVGSVTPTVSGTSDPAGGAVTVSVYDGSYATGTPAQTLTAPNSNGVWTLSLGALANNTTYSVQAAQSNGVATGRSAPVSFAVDTSSPVVTLTTPTDGSTVRTATPTFGGAAGTAPGDHTSVDVKIFAGTNTSAASVQTLTANVVSGSWAVAPTVGLDAGLYTALALQSNANGNTTTTAPTSFTVDLGGPTVTVIAPTSGAVLATGTPTISGTASGTNDVSVRIYRGASATGTSVQILYQTVSPDGSWSAAPAPGLADGTYTLLASQTDEFGNVGNSPTVTFSVDTAAPAVTLTAPTAGSTVATSSPLFAGAAGITAGDSGTVTVDVFAGGDLSGSSVTSVSAPVSSGNWATSAALPDGTYTVQAVQVDAAGNIGRSPAVTFIIDTAAPAVTLDAPVSGTTITSGNLSATGTAGTATSDNGNVVLRVYGGGAPTGTAVQVISAPVAADGSWAASVNSLAEGMFTLQASQTDSAGNGGVSQSVTVTVDTSAPVVTMTTPEAGSTVATTNPTFSGAAGTADGDADVVTVRLYAGASTAGTLVATLAAPVVGGAWSVSGPPLADGDYTAQATQSDTAGHSSLSAAVTFTVDTTAPGITLDTPTTGSAITSLSLSASGNAGTATGDGAAVTVRVYNGPSVTGALAQQIVVTALADGSWSARFDGLPNATYTLQASQNDSAGNAGVSQASTVTLGSAYQVTAASPAGIGQGATSRTVTLTGSGFTSGVAVSLSGSGIAIKATTVASPTSIEVTLDISSSAAIGARDITVSSSGQRSATCTGCLVVNAAPKPTSLSPATLGQGAQQRTVTIAGTGFVSGATVTFSGTGVTGTVTGVTATQITVTVTVAENAGLGSRGVTVVNVDGGTGSCAACFTVATGPKVTAVTPASVKRGTTVTLTVTGSSFDRFTKVSISGTGVSVGKLTFKNTTTLTVVIKVSATSPTGLRDVTVTNPSDSGSGTCTGCLTVT